jgi:hypothetical protein
MGQQDNRSCGIERTTTEVKRLQVPLSRGTEEERSDDSGGSRERSDRRGTEEERSDESGGWGG